MFRTIKGGQAIPLGRGFYYMRGRKHEQGGIDVDRNLEVEDKEVVQLTHKSIKVYSAQPILNGMSPAKAVLGGANPNKVFNAQENFKDKHNLNDDGSRKAKMGKEETITETNDRRIAESDLAQMKRKQKAIEDNERIKNNVKTLATNVAENIPGVDNLIMIKDIYNDINNKNYLSAGITGGLAMIPFVGPKVNKVLKDVVNVGRTLGIDPKSIYYNIAHRKELKDAVNKAKDFYFNDVTKRLDTKTANDLVNNPNNFKRIKFGYVANGKGGTRDSNILHQKMGDVFIDPNKFDNLDDIDATVVHELRHRFDGNIEGHNPKYTSIKVNTPSVDINPKYKGKHAKKDTEIKANNTQTRYSFYKKDKNNTDNYIKNTTDKDFYNTFVNTTADNKHYANTSRRKLTFNLNNFPISTVAIGTAGATLINKINQNQKTMGGKIERRPFTGGRKQSKTTARLSTIEEQRKLAQRVNETNALSNNVEHPEVEVLPNIEVTATAPHHITDWEIAGRYPFGKYRPPFRRYNNRVLPISTPGEVDDRYNLFINAGNHLGVRYPILSLPTGNTTTDNTIVDNTTSLRTNVSPFRAFDFDAGELPEVTVTAPATVHSQPPVKGQLSIRPTQTGRKPTLPTRRSISPVTTIEYNAKRNSEDILRGGIFTTKAPTSIGKNIDISPVDKPSIEIMDEKVKTPSSSRQLPRTSNLFKDNADSIISAASDLIGTGVSYFSNRNAINSMRAPSVPTPRFATKLKTKINVNPQLDKMRETVRNYEDFVNNNTLSSSVARNNIGRMRLNSILQANQIYANKENAETELINQDRMNRQNVANQTIADYNTYQDKLTEYNNKIADLKGENRIGLISGINSIVQNTIRNRKLDEQFEANVEAIDRANPYSAKYDRTYGPKRIRKYFNR